MKDWAADFDPPGDEDVKKSVADGELISLRIADLTPAAQDMYRKQTKDVGFFEKNPKIYLRSGSSENALVEVTTKEGTRYFEVGEPSHRWTAEDVRSSQPSNADIDEKITKALWEDARNAGLSQKTYQQYAALSKAAGIDSPPAIYVSNDLTPESTSSIPYASAGQTKEGKPYILVNRTALKYFTPKQFLGVVGEHELEHILDGDTTPEGVAATHNNPALQIAIEQRADIAGALRGCDPKALKEGMAAIITRNRNFFMKALPHSAEQDYAEFEERTNTDHPATEKRLAALISLEHFLVKNPDGTCTVVHYDELVKPYIDAAKYPDNVTKGR